MPSYAIVGFGCAGYHALKAIRNHDPLGKIDIYSDHPDAPYNPMLTTYYAANRLCYEGMFPFGTLDDIKHSYGANIYSETSVQTVDAVGKNIIFAGGESRHYDRILIATGARALVPPIPNACPERTLYMRTLQDSLALKKVLEKTEGTNPSAVVVGASMVGIKVAEVLLNNGYDTTLVDFAAGIFPLAAYPETAARIEKHITDCGIHQKYNAGLTSIEKGMKKPLAVHCSDGSVLDADYIVLCIGTRANTQIVDPEQIKLGRAIIVDENMQTSTPDIYAAGDCCEGNNLQSGQSQIIGLWANAAYQGHTAGASMVGSKEPFAGNILHNITHFLDIDFIGFGDNRIKGEHLTFENKAKGLWIEAVKADGQLVGINILGNYRISGILKNHILNVIRSHANHISEMQRGILLREGLSEDFIEQLEVE